jgi:transcriptional regulator with XRE-family HTH domain
MDLTQRELADLLEVRQQTISEWETGLHTPHRSTQKTLTMVAERAGFSYDEHAPLGQAASNGADGEHAEEPQG